MVKGGKRSFAMLGSTVVAAVWVMGSVVAIAQTAKDSSVRERARPEFDPIGILLGVPTFSGEAAGPLSSFILYPQVELDLIYSNNIFKTEFNKKSDFIAVLKPSLDLKSDWDNHALNFGIGAAIGRYNDHGGEDFEEYRAQIDGKYDTSESDHLDGELSYERLHEDRGSPDDAGTSGPTEMERIAAETSYRYQPDALLVQPQLNYVNLDFDDNGTVNHDDRDRDEYAAKVRVGYEFFEGTMFFVEPSWKVVEYDYGRDDNNYDRDSHGGSLRLGLTYDLSAVTFLEAGVGYTWRNFDDEILKDVDGLDFLVRALWNPTDLMTVEGVFERNIRETTRFGVGGFHETRIAASVDYEVTDSVVAGVAASFARQEADLVQANLVVRDETDNFVQFEVGADYLVNENIYSRAAYHFERRTSTSTVLDYDEHRFLIRIGFQY